MKNACAISTIVLTQDSFYPTLEFKKIKVFSVADSFNGSSGYERQQPRTDRWYRNAAMEVLGKERLILDRSGAYIGVLIDDLVTKENHEPCRMMTSRAEYPSTSPSG